MRRNTYLFTVVAATIVLFTFCKKPYNPQEIAVNPNILIVEGLINSGADSTFIKLSRTVKLSDANTVKPELKATLNVEDDQNTSYPLKELGAGRYATAALSLNPAKKYRLRIRTTDGLVYLSSLESVKNAPPIDSVGFKAEPSGVTIWTNAHDNSLNTRYYRWDYEETWRFHVKYNSAYVSNGTAIIPRAQSIYYCFANANSTNIALTSTVRLTQDVVNQAPIAYIPAASDRLQLRYSILVKQYALTQPAYEFWSNIKKNTETLGGIFDAQPSAPIGNIQCITNPAQPVVGFISVGNIQTKRIFIDRSQLPDYETEYPENCSYRYVYFFNTLSKENEVEKVLVPLPNDLIPIIDFTDQDGSGYSAAGRPCTDCTLRGKLKPPAFWK